VRYVELINGLIQDEIRDRQNIILFGQNIGTGSCLGGLTRNLSLTESSRLINTTNAENTLVGVGFGLMLNGISSIFFVKQLDFVLLGMDQIVNTNNYVRLSQSEASFTIVPIVVDSGYQGIQSSFNGFSDVCSLARIPGYLINGSGDATRIIKSELFRPGVKMIGVSQRLFGIEGEQFPSVRSATKNNEIFEYYDGQDLTIVCFNLSLTYGVELHKVAKDRGMSAALYNVNCVELIDWTMIDASILVTNRLVVIDDSKTVMGLPEQLVSRLNGGAGLEFLEIIKRRGPFEDTLRPSSDELSFDAEAVLEAAFRA